MKIIVAVKRVIDYNVKVRIKADGSGVETANVKMSMNPFDEIAVEQGVKLRESGVASEMIAVSIGPKQCQETIRTALAMGADRGIHIETDAEIQPLAAAKLLAAVAKREMPELIILGKQAIDDDANQTGQMLAGLLGRPQGTNVSKLEFTPDKSACVASREVDDGLEVLTIKMPAVITVDLRLNTPRFATLPNIMKAKKKPIAVITPQEMNVDIAPRLTTIKVATPAKRQAGVILKSVAELVDKLRNEAKVIP